MNPEIYNAAREGFAVRAMNHWGRFRVSGADAAALLHHLTTNEIKKLRAGQTADAALVSSKGRLLDVVSVFRDTAGFTVLTAPNRRALFAPHARQFVLFRQDIKIEDVSDMGFWLGIFGPGAEAVLKSKSLVVPEAGAVVQIENFFVARTNRLPGGGFFLWSLAADAPNFDAPLCDNETFNVLRIEAGVPVAGLEIVDSFNPWEAGLTSMVSLHKGCYNGQEIIARLNTYGKVKQRLCGVKLGSVPETFPVELKAENKNAGMLTSAAHSPRFGPIGLAYVRGAHEIGATLQANDQAAEVVALPFE